jgi:hypothetical protein
LFLKWQSFKLKLYVGIFSSIARHFLTFINPYFFLLIRWLRWRIQNVLVILPDPAFPSTAFGHSDRKKRALINRSSQFCDEFLWHFLLDFYTTFIRKKSARSQIVTKSQIKKDFWSFHNRLVWPLWVSHKYVTNGQLKPDFRTFLKPAALWPLLTVTIQSHKWFQLWPLQCGTWVKYIGSGNQYDFSTKRYWCRGFG